MKATLSNYRQAPRKTRLLADLVRGKKVDDALTTLTHTNKRATTMFIKLIKSAAANARENDKTDVGDLYIKTVAINDGVTLHRVRPVSRGNAHSINKRTSNVTLELGVQDKESAQEDNDKKETRKGTK